MILTMKIYLFNDLILVFQDRMEPMFSIVNCELDLYPDK